MMMLKILNNKIMLSSAGMPHALIYRQENRAVEEIELKGMPLGAVKNFPYQLKETTIEYNAVVK